VAPDGASRRALVGDLPATLLRLAADGGALYGLVAPAPPATPGRYAAQELSCSRPGAPCVVERLDPPPLRPLDQVARSPFF
jgi:hypothetical protein